MAVDAITAGPAARAFWRTLYLQIRVAIVLEALVGWLFPAFGAPLRRLGDGSVKLARMVITPVIILIVVTGITGMADLKAFERVGAKAMAKFLTLPTLALVIGPGVGNLAYPSTGLEIDRAPLHARAVVNYVIAARDRMVADFVLHIIPDTAISRSRLERSFIIAILLGIALALLGDKGEQLPGTLKMLYAVVFWMVHILMRAASIEALGVPAFAVGRYGIGKLVNLPVLIRCYEQLLREQVACRPLILPATPRTSCC